MSARVKVMIRRKAASAKGQRQPTEAVILRDEQVVAVLLEGDPLRYLLQLPAERLHSMKANLAPVLEERPRVREVLEAITEYKVSRALEQPDAR